MDLIKKTCNSCSKLHEKLPEKTKFNELGAWFNCECKSTLFIPRRHLPVKFLIDELRRHPDVAFVDITFAEEINKMEGA